MQRDSRQRGAATGFTFETALENEGEVLDALLAALTRNQVPAGAWSNLHLAAVRDDRLVQLAEAYAAVAGGKRLKASPPQIVAEFLYRAGLFSADAANDTPRSMDYWQRALAAFPGHPAAFGRLESVLVDAGDRRAQADLYITQAHQRPRAEQADFLRRAVTLLEEEDGTDAILVEQYQEILRLDARDDETREKLTARYLAANRPRDVVRLLEQALTADPPPSDESAREIRGKLIQLYAGPLKEVERTMPHVEALLAIDPEHDEARTLAHRLLEVKALAGRAAAALAQATEATGTPTDVAKILAIELEHTRGPKRRDVLRRLGVVRQDGLGDEAGAYEAFEQALALDATDDEVLGRYTKLASSLHKELDAGRSLARFGAAARDPHVRARLSAAVGQLYLSGGDAKRARVAFVSVLAMPDLPDDVVLVVSRSLCAIYASERDFRSLADSLERVALLEPNEDLRQTANEELAELAQLTLRDAARSIAAWRRLVDTPARARALAALEPLYAATGNAQDLAYILEERSKDEVDADAALTLAFRAAEVLTTKGGDRAAASDAWARFSQRFGAHRAALAHWIPLLEASGDWARLSMAIEGEASLASDDERAPLFVKLGQIRLQRTHDPAGAIEAFAQALAANPAEATSRSALEKLLTAGADRLAAARVLEPYYRAERHVAGILRILDLKASSSESADERMEAIQEALGMTEGTDPPRAVDWTARALDEAVRMRGDVGAWVDRLAGAVGPTKPRPLAHLLTKALGTLVVDSDALLGLARRAAEAHFATGDVATALALYRRALAFDAESPALLARVDELLREQGSPAERVTLYRNALEKGPSPERRRELMHTIGRIQRKDLNDAASAVATYEAALADDPRDQESVAALADLYAETERWETLLRLLESSLGHASVDDARGIRARMAEVAAKQGDLGVARGHAEALLADDSLSEPDLVVIERVASALEDTTMLRAVLGRKAAIATDPERRVEWLDRLGALELSCAAPDLAVATWKRAAGAAEEIGQADVARGLYERAREVSPGDPEAAEKLAALVERAEDWPKLPELYAVMLEHAVEPVPRIAVLMRHARLLAEHLDDAGGALVSAAQAFELASGSPEYRDVLSTFTMLALRGKATHIFAQAMDDGIARNAGPDDERGQRRAELRMAKARVLSTNREGRDAATAAYRAILEDAGTADPQVKSALHAFESLLSSETPDARRADRRWLFSWRAERALGAEKAAALEAWAGAEESTFGEPDAALELYRRALELDSENVRVLSAVARLALGKGDAEGAVTALEAQRERSTGAARRAVDLEIASTLLHRLSRPGDALVAVSRVLAEAPDDPTALALATALIADASTRDAMAKVLESARKESQDPGVRATILRTLLDATGEGAAPPSVRQEWYDALYDLLREDGRTDAAFETILAATYEQPEVSAFWDRAEELCREIERPKDLADAYVRALARDISKETATTLGQRGVAFNEEWFEDGNGVVRILERVLELDSGAGWAFDRLKLLFDSNERWTELFALYDRTILTADDERKASLYEDAAQVAKDFANDSDRAVGYLEKLLALRPTDAHLVASLERLYERKGAYRELVDLLTRQIGAQKPADAHRTRARVAQLWLEELGDPGKALAVADEMRTDGSPAGAAEAYGLIERVMSSAPREAYGADASEKPVRYRAAATLREHYERSGLDGDLARLLEVELEITSGTTELIAGHRKIATFRSKLGEDANALEHVAALVLLDPDVSAYRTELTELAAKVGRYDRLAEVLAQAGEKAQSEVLRTELTAAAGDVWVANLGDEERGMRAYLDVLAAKVAPPALLLTIARKVEPLLERASRAWDLLEVLERLAALEDTTASRARAWTLAARLATSLGDTSRAIKAWEARLTEEEDTEALDALVVLLERDARWAELLVALRRRVGGERPADERQADRSRIAHVLQDRLADLDGAIREWAVAESEFGPTDESTDALSTLLEKTEQWTLLEEKLSAAAGRAPTPARRAALNARLGDVSRLHKSDFARASLSYDAALAADPAEVVARAGLLAMANAGSSVREALQSLLTAYEKTDDWQETLALAPLRLGAADDDPARVRVLVESASLAEKRGDDPAQAFDFQVRAFLLAPDLADVASDVQRLGAVTESWQRVADAHEEVLASPTLMAERSATLGDAIWRAGFRYRLGKVKDERLADAAGALAVYELASQESPADTVIALTAIDVAARLSRWDAVACATVRVSRGLGEAGEEVLAATEKAADASRAWDALTAALASEIGGATDLAPKIARDLEARLGVWHRDRRGDPDAAEAAFSRALVHDASNTELLTWLARIQRRAKGRPLVDSLLRLSQATGGDLELLREAADIAITSLEDRSLAKSVLASIIALAETRWSPASRADVTPFAGDDGEPGPVSVGPTVSPAPVVRWAVQELARIHDHEGNPEKTVDLLTATARLPWEPAEARRMLHTAAQIARDGMRDDARATALYEGLFDSDPSDASATEALVLLYKAREKQVELLRLYARLVENAPGPEDRIRVRLSAAALEGSLGHPDAAIALLRANLGDSPRHGESLDAIVAVVEANDRFADLADLHVNQAELAEAAGDSAMAAVAWMRAAEVAETRLSDPERAIRHHRRALPLEEHPVSLDALARLVSGRGDHAAAAEFLRRLLAVAPGDERTALTLRLVDELAAAGDPATARRELEAAAAEQPDDEALGRRLVAMYEEHGAWDALADLKRTSASRATDPETKLRHLRSAAELFARRTATPEAAIPLLEEAALLDADDRAIKFELADALVRSERYSEARTLLRAVVDSFGGRRPKERGVAHYHLALLEVAVGQRAQALVELDAAMKIDPGNGRILRTLAELALADGQVDRAERSYRALLVALKRPEESTEDFPVVRSEVLLELSSIAVSQGHADRARELLESALESASKNVVEGRRLESGLREKKDFPTLVRALEARLARATTDADRVEVLTELARVLDVELGHLAAAFTARQRVLALTPTAPAAHEAALALARRADGVARYLDDVEALAIAEEKQGHRETASALYLRLAVTLEGEHADDARILSALERSLATATFDAPPESATTPAPSRRPTLSKQAMQTIRALDPVYARLGRTADRARLLAQRVEMESSDDDPASAADARYRLAEIVLASAEGALEGGLLVSQALDLDHDFTRAEAVVRAGVARHQGDEGLIDLFERIGRNEGREGALLDALELRSRLLSASPDAAREAVAVARQLGDAARAESLLVRYVEGRDGEDVAWAFEEVAGLREALGDAAGAIDWKTRAAGLVVASEARRLRFEIAKLTLDALGDRAAAAALYEALFEDDPTDRAAWEPMLAAYRALGDSARLAHLLARVSEQEMDDSERTQLRFERVRLLVDPLGQVDDAMSSLSDLVADDPNFTQAAVLLADLFDKAGKKGELRELLDRQIDAAKDRQDAKHVEALSLRKAQLVASDDADDARATLYSALDWTPDSLSVLELLESLLSGDDARAERLDIKERALRVTTPDRAEQAALALAEMRTADGDSEAAERALEAGYRANPASRLLRDKLEASYREANATVKLADLYAIEAQSFADPAARVARLREVAALYAQIPDMKRATETLGQAYALAKDDVPLALELAGAFTAARDLASAIGTLSSALDAVKDDAGQRASLLLERATLRVELGDDETASHDLIAVARLGVINVSQALDVELERLRARAEARGDSVIERSMRLELATVRAEVGDLDAARPLVTELLRREPKDREALRLVARIEERAERWDAATVAYRRLIPLEEGDLAVDTALRLADACERAGRLADARGALERTRTVAPHDQALRARLERLYESVEAFRELAELSLADARDTEDPAARHGHLKRAAALLLRDGSDNEAAIDALMDAQALAPDDMETTLLLVDAYTVAGRTDEAREIVSARIATRAGRRSPELASLYHRLARVANASGDRAGELAALTSGLEADAQNGLIASELASLALEVGDVDVATRALRSITLLKDPSTSPLPKGLAYQYLGEIARQQGDSKRAMLLLKRALEDDPSLETARSLIEELRAEGL